MRDLTTCPLWQPDELGRPIPESPHAVSACLPTWQDNLGYEEQDPRVHGRMTTGYPRFVYNALCRELFERCRERIAQPGEACLVFPSAASAGRCARWLRDVTGAEAGIHAVGWNGVHAVVFPQPQAAQARAYWQHTGEGISSRQAEACLCGRSPFEAGDAESTLRGRIAGLAGVAQSSVRLFPCGMNAVYALHRALSALFPGRKSVQFGFPYVDSLKIQEKFGPGVHFFPRGDADELDQLGRLLQRKPAAAIYTEFPSNPLLASPDLERLVRLARQHDLPLIVDETIAGFANVDVLGAADVIVSSLTKSFSGVGDVTGGSLIFNPTSSIARELGSRLDALLFEDDEDRLWCEDAVVLERNSRDYVDRARRMNSGAERLADFLHQHPRVAAVYYPGFVTPERYAVCRRPEGGCGCLLSIVLHDARQATPLFFDALRVSKGPNLGTNYTLACPYTILAHYHELDFAERCGVSRWLVRVSVGLEPADDLIARFAEALEG